ncbi:Piso0_000076 [Millerozyma farinosa CBS 7064]|uniref:Piso0_000076 protein n=1 Tax=Pichia sorbitophila (strain ATCC MYA-4447 / BCRC 22081 / CBS 7064 / NBRC 10061 / NRRL Y-12695) TaxID=559304 RepID=G8YT12_PICSO|nr:Piso0_000076 [Millerozyma farinosa CBS 7064]
MAKAQSFFTHYIQDAIYHISSLFGSIIFSSYMVYILTVVYQNTLNKNNKHCTRIGNANSEAEMRDLELYISLGFRAAQCVFAVISLALAAGIIGNSNYGSNRDIFTIVVSSMSLVYLVLTVVLYSYIPILAVFSSEFILMVFWLTVFALYSADFGASSCSTTYFYNGNVFEVQSTQCRSGKAALAFGLLEWLLFFSTFTLSTSFTTVPSYRTQKINALLMKDSFVSKFSTGALFLSKGPIMMTNEEEDPNVTKKEGVDSEIAREEVPQTSEA